MTVYDIGEFKVRVKRDYGGITYAGDKECHHKNLTYDENGETIECDDCKKQITAWWSFLHLVRDFAKIADRHKAAAEQIKLEQQRTLTHKAAIAVEDAWRGRKMIPCCPHCTRPILPGDRFGSSTVNREMTISSAKPMEFRANLTLLDGDEQA
jgi:hypothetical protein